MSIVVLGAGGQLATHLRTALPGAAFWGRDTLDMADARALETALVAAGPRAIVNAAAYTAVDRAESEPELAWRINAEAPAAASRAATKLGAVLVQVSTDYVFDGRAEAPYGEDTPVHPLGVYGATKLAGELAVRALCPHHWILRTSWLFSEHGTNFVKTVLRLAAGPTPLRIVSDQVGTPTYAGHLGRVIAALVPGPEHAAGMADAPHLPYGTYHATGGPPVSWHAFAEHILRHAKACGLLPDSPPVLPIATADYPTAARRPRNGVLAPSVALNTLIGRDLDWREGLEQALDALKVKEAIRI